MAHVVESGSGSATANAYLSSADADTYFTDHGAPAAWTGTQAVKEEAIRLATQYLDANYGGRWRGMRASSAQALAWPRTGAVDDDSYTIDGASLPTRLTQACAELALDAIATPDLMPDVSDPGALASLTQTVGPISISKSWIGGRVDGTQRKKVDALLRPLLISGNEVIRA